MFSFMLDTKKFSKMVPFCGESLDIIYLQGSVLIVSEGGLSYAHHVIPMAISEQVNNVETVKVPTEMFSRLAIDGKVAIIKSDLTTTIEFYGSQDRTPKYSATVPNQITISKYKEVLDMVLSKDKYDKVSLKEHETLIKLVSRLKSDIISLDGILYSYVKNSYVYQNTNLIPFACQGESLNKCMNLSDSCYLIGKYLLFIDEEIGVFVALNRNQLPKGNDLARIVGSSAKYKFKCNFENLNMVIKSLKANEYDITLNLGISEAVIGMDSYKFSATVPCVRELSTREKRMDIMDMMNSAPVRTDFRIKLPYWIFSIIGNQKSLELFIKSTTSVIRFNGITVVFGGGLIE